MWSVRVLSGAQAGQIFDLKPGKNLFGRGGQSDFKVSSSGISKEHCEIHVYKDKMMVVDLKSSNGTFVNGVKVQSSLIHIGDKLSLFDIILDVIPTPDIRPKKKSKKEIAKVLAYDQPSTIPTNDSSLPPIPLNSTHEPHGIPQPHYPHQGNAALQMGQNPYAQHEQQLQQSPFVQQPSTVSNPTIQPALTFKEKTEKYIENVVMPAIYRLAILFPFKQVLLGFVLVFIFLVTSLSVIPLHTITEEANYAEAAKRAKSVARAMAKINEQALLSGQFNNLSTQEAMKEEGIKEALIIQQTDGAIIAPSEKVGRDTSRPFILQARRETRPSVGMIDSKTIGATHPIGVYDPSTGEPSVKYHAIVYYDVSSLNIDSNRLISLFMQTLVIASLLGLAIYFIFARLIEYPIKKLNQQIDSALMDKSNHTEVLFDYPVFQKLVTNVNLLLSKAQSGNNEFSKPKPNRIAEYTNLVEMVSHPAVVFDAEEKVIALNPNFEQLCQTGREHLINYSATSIPDTALAQNIESILARCKTSPYETHSDRIPFSQFECEIHGQAFLSDSGDPEYYIITLNKLSENMEESKES